MHDITSASLAVPKDPSGTVIGSRVQQDAQNLD
jgi:hypothetical protein